MILELFDARKLWKWLFCFWHNRNSYLITGTAYKPMFVPLIWAVFDLKRICQSFSCATVVIHDVCISIISIFLMLCIYSVHIWEWCWKESCDSVCLVWDVMMMMTMCDYYYVRVQCLLFEWQLFSEGRLRAQDLMQYELQALRPYR